MADRVVMRALTQCGHIGKNVHLGGVLPHSTGIPRTHEEQKRRQSHPCEVVQCGILLFEQGTMLVLWLPGVLDGCLFHPPLSYM